MCLIINYVMLFIQELEDFEFLKVLGKGTIAKVSVVVIIYNTYVI